MKTGKIVQLQIEIGTKTLHPHPISPLLHSFLCLYACTENTQYRITEREKKKKKLWIYEWTRVYRIFKYIVIVHAVKAKMNATVATWVSMDRMQKCNVEQQTTKKAGCRKKTVVDTFIYQVWKHYDVCYIIIIFVILIYAYIVKSEINMHDNDKLEIQGTLSFGKKTTVNEIGNWEFNQYSFFLFNRIYTQCL